MQKRGQVAIFVVVGILILILFGMFVYMETSAGTEKLAANVQEAQQSNQLESPVQVYVETCLERTGEEALLSVGKHGGYLDLPAESDQVMQLPYYLFENASYVPPLDTVLKELAAYVNLNLHSCLNNFESFKEQGYDVRAGRGEMTTMIGKNELHFIAEFPVIIKAGNEEIQLNSFSAAVSTRLDEMLSLVNGFITQQEEDPSAFCVSCLADVGVLYEMRAEVDFVEEGILMFTIIDKAVPVDEKPLKWYFLNQYEVEELEEPIEE